MKTGYKLLVVVLLGMFLCVSPVRALVPIIDAEQASLTLGNIASMAAQKAIQMAMSATGIDTILAMGEAGMKMADNLMNTADSMANQATEAATSAKDGMSKAQEAMADENETQDEEGWS